MANVKQVFNNFYVGNELLAKNRKELAFLLNECKKHGFKYKVSRSINENYRYLVEAEEWQNSPKDIFVVSLREIEQWGIYNGEPMYTICGEIAELYKGNSRDEAFKVMQTWTTDLTKLIENHFDCVEGTPGFEDSLKRASFMLFVDKYLETVDGEDIYADELSLIDYNYCANAYGEINLSPIEIEEDLTPAQDEFFKDSIVRKKGKLVPVYHGTYTDFDEFGENSGLIWTTINKEYATEFSLGSGKVKEVYVNLTNPLIIGPTNVPFEEFMSYMIPSNKVVPSEQVKKLADKLNVSVDVLVDIFNSIDESVPKHRRRLFQVVNKPAFRQLVIDAGYDGVVCNEPALTFGVVNANQLKYVNNENPTASKKLNEGEVEISEDVDIELEQTPGYQYKDITMQISNKLTDLGITDIKFYQPIYEGRFNALWFEDGTICTGRYKEFGVCIGAYSRYIDIKFGEGDEEITVATMQDLEDLGVFDDDDYYNLYDTYTDYEIYDEPELYFQIYDPANEAELLNSAESEAIYVLNEMIDYTIPGNLEYLETNIEEFRDDLTKPVEEDGNIFVKASDYRVNGSLNGDYGRSRWKPISEGLASLDSYSPIKVGKAYKVFKVKNGKLYPPMVANPDGADTPIGVWLAASEGEFAGLSKTGRPQVKSTGSGPLAYRPGWHLGELPIATQFYRTNKETGEREFPKDFVWAECDYVMDIDYQSESDEQGHMRIGKDGKEYRSNKYQHSLAGLKKIPKDGFYKYRTNPNPDTVPWIITGAMKVNKVLNDNEVEEILSAAGVSAPNREGGKMDSISQLGITESCCKIEESLDLSNIEVYSFGDKKWNATSQELLDLVVEAGAPVDTSTEPEKRNISLENFDVFYPFEEYDLDENSHLYCLIGVIDEMEEAGIPFEYFEDDEEGNPSEYCMVDMLDLVQYGEESGYDATVIPFEGQYVIYLHNDKPSNIGAIEITEDVDDSEIELSQIEIPKLTDITNKYKQLFESYGFTDIIFNKPIFEERRLALWYYDSDESLVTMKYKDRYYVELVVDEMYYHYVNGDELVKDISEFEGSGLYTDKDILDHTSYYEDSDENTIFEYEADSRFWFRVLDSQNNNFELDNYFWIERSDDVWEMSEIKNALDDFDEFIKLYEKERGESIVTEEVDNIELTNINSLEISDYVDTVENLFHSVGHTPVYFPRTNDWGLKDETGQITWKGMSANSVIDMFEGEIDWLMEDWFEELAIYGLADKVPVTRDEIYNWDEFLEVFGDKSIYNTPELKDFYNSHKFNIDAIDFMVNGREDFDLMSVPHDTDYNENLDAELINAEEED